MVVVDIFLKADSAEQAREAVHRRYSRLAFARTYSMEDGYSLNKVATTWALTHQTRRTDVLVDTDGKHIFRVNGELH